MNQWCKDAYSNEAKSTQIERGEKTWRLSISRTKPKNIPEVDMSIHINNTEARREANRRSASECRDSISHPAVVLSQSSTVSDTSFDLSRR